MARPRLKAQPRGDRDSDLELAQLAPLIPSFQAALQGDSVDAQRATLSVIADIPPSLVVGTNLAVALKTFLQKKIDDPEILALGLRSFGRSFPDAPDIKPILGRHVRDDAVVVRHAAADGLANALINSFPARTAEPRYAYFVDVAKQAIPLLGVGIADKDPATQKAALGGIRRHGRRDRGVVCKLPRAARSGCQAGGPASPIRSANSRKPMLATAAAKLETPLRSADAATRIAAARALESLALLRKAIKNSGRPGEPAPADPFAGGWKFIGDSVAAGMKDPNPNVRLAMTEAIESLGDAIEVASANTRRHPRSSCVRPLGGGSGLGESAPAKPDIATYAPEVESLARLLDDRDPDVRTAAINALGKFGPAAKSATPKLLASVGKGDIEPRVAAVTALGAVGSDAATTVPVLIAGLQNADLRLRRASALGLVRFRAAAKPALPELRKALADPDADLRLAATEAVLAIEQKGRFKEL